MWKHDYYLDYQHRYLDYIATFLGYPVDWDFANHNPALALQERAQVPLEREAAARTQI